MNNLEKELESEIKNIPEEDVYDKIYNVLKRHNIDFDIIDDESYPGGFRVIKGSEYKGKMLFEIFTTTRCNDEDELVYTFDKIIK